MRKVEELNNLTYDELLSYCKRQMDELNLLCELKESCRDLLTQIRFLGKADCKSVRELLALYDCNYRS